MSRIETSLVLRFIIIVNTFVRKSYPLTKFRDIEGHAQLFCHLRAINMWRWCGKQHDSPPLYRLYFLDRCDQLPNGVCVVPESDWTSWKRFTLRYIRSEDATIFRNHYAIWATLSKAFLERVISVSVDRLRVKWRTYQSSPTRKFNMRGWRREDVFAKHWCLKNKHNWIII